MNEINENLIKLQSQVMQINDMFKKQTRDKSEYVNYLNISIVRVVILFLFFACFLYMSKPDFCCDEVIDEETFFKNKVINSNYVIGISIIFTGVIIYFTNQIHF